MPEESVVICLTPVKNEAWILDRFLASASLWADHVIVADQGSDDASRDIALRHSKVTLVENPDPTYDEGGRQRLLLREARQIPGKRVIIALDADEALTGNWRDTEEWHRILSAPPGTVLNFEWANIRPDWKSCWIPPGRVPFGFVDDGREHSGSALHSNRIPGRDESPSIELTDIKVLHLQYTAWERMKSKQRWYQCWERLNHPRKRPVQIYRQYHHMDAIPEAHLRPVRQDWLAGYVRHGIDFTATAAGERFWTDGEVLRWLQTFGTARFRRLDIWDVDWAALARKHGFEVSPELLRDPRNRVERAVHDWLRRTQSRQMKPGIRLLQRLLIPLGW